LKIRTILIEDEQDAREHMVSLLRDHCPNIELIGQATDVVSGLKLIDESNPELLISDIMLPDGTAFDMLNQLTEIAFNIIFTTAHSDFAVKAFKISAIDYLLKPIDIDELQAATKKAEVEISGKSASTRIKTLVGNLSPSNLQSKKIVLSIGPALHVIYISEIIFCQSIANRTSFVLMDDRKLLTSTNISEYEDMLNEYGFFRPHRQFLINIHHILSLDRTNMGTIRMAKGFEVPVSIRRKQMLVDLISML
jgi:two-component system, LytTR family, response regulator